MTKLSGFQITTGNASPYMYVRAKLAIISYRFNLLVLYCTIDTTMIAFAINNMSGSTNHDYST